MNTKRMIVLVIGFCLTPLLLLAQGLYWEQTTKVSMGGAPREMHTKGYMKSMKLKTVGEEDSHVGIVRADKEMIYMVNPKEKTYSEMSFDDLEKQMAAASEEMKKAQEQLKDLPPEQRKMMEGMMGGMMKDVDYAVEKTGEKKTVAGYSCEKVLLKDGEKVAGTFWVTKDLGTMTEYAKDWSKLMDKIARGPMAKMLKKLSDLGGFVMESSMSGVSTMTTKLEKRSVSDGEFEVPEGYKKTEMEGMGGMKKREE